MKICIIGAGLGGLFTGAILAKEGCEVTVLEKNATIGGGLQSFCRFGKTFDTGMHVVGGMRPGGNIWRICQYLGIADKARLMDVDDDCTDSLYFAEDERYYTIAQGREGFVESLAKSFPNERDGLERYVDAVMRVAEASDLFNLRPSTGSLTPFTSLSEFLMSATDFIAQFTTDPKLRAVLAYMNPFYGGRPGKTPAYVHAIISTLYIRGASRFVGGSCHFADLLAGVITSHGGKVLPGDGVEWVEVARTPSPTGSVARHVEYVRTKKGHVYTADRYVSGIHPCTLLQLMDERSFPKAFRERLDSIPNSFSAFSLFIKLKPGTFPYINHSEYYMTRYDDVWNFSRTDRPWPLGYLFMTPPEEVNAGAGSRVCPQTAVGAAPSVCPQFATKALVTAPMPFEMVSRWAGDYRCAVGRPHLLLPGLAQGAASTPGHRGAGYEEWKEEMAVRLLRQIEEVHPGFGQCIEAMNTASPLTIRDYYGAKEGTICGFSKDCHNLALSQVPVVTKIDNLLLTGQNNNLHGFCGVPLTAINTAEAILGTNHVLNSLFPSSSLPFQEK